MAGTTRDVVEQAVQLGDIQLNLFDTAGLRETEDAIEAEASAAAGKAGGGRLILAVFDGSEPPTRKIWSLHSVAQAVQPLHLSTKRINRRNLMQSG